MSALSTTSTEMEDKKGVDVKCHRCKYEWTYTGELWYATCPNCQTKVNVQAQRPNDDEHDK